MSTFVRSIIIPSHGESGIKGGAYNFVLKTPHPALPDTIEVDIVLEPSMAGTVVNYLVHSFALYGGHDITTLPANILYAPPFNLPSSDFWLQGYLTTPVALTAVFANHNNVSYYYGILGVARNSGGSQTSNDPSPKDYNLIITPNFSIGGGTNGPQQAVVQGFTVSATEKKHLQQLQN